MAGSLLPASALTVDTAELRMTNAQSANRVYAYVDWVEVEYDARFAAPFGDAVTFAGYQSQAGVAQAMAAADIFVLPSFAEGVPVGVTTSVMWALPAAPSGSRTATVTMAPRRASRTRISLSES